ncbi:MAG: cytochrome c peroxidase [Planctomycetaceae bacterium]
MFPRRLLLTLLVLSSWTALVFSGDDLRNDSHFRRPVAAVSVDDGRTLALACRDSGSVALVDTTDWTVRSEHAVGRQLADLAFLDAGRRLLTVDPQAHELIVLQLGDNGLTVESRLPIARHPVSVSVTPDGPTVCVASLWSRCLTLFGVRPSTPAGPLQISRRDEIRLPFAPRLQCPLSHDRLLVADSFGGRLAIVDTANGRLECLRELPGHNIRGLALAPNGRELFVAHQSLDQYAPTTYDSIHWGNLVENLIRVLPIDALRNPALDPVAMGRAMPFGSTGGGAADPAGLAFVSKDRLIAVSSGVDRAQIFPTLHPIISPTIPTGRRPTSVVVLPQLACAVVINTLGDSLTIVDSSSGKVIRDVSLGPTPEPGPQQRGESLFFDAHTSHDGWISCHTCHTDGHSCGLLADTHGDGSFGTPKRILSLLGTRDNNPWAWNGSLRTLHEQTRQSVESSMVGDLAAEQINDLVAYLHTLEAPPPLRPTAETPDDEQLIAHGREVFSAQGCARCHVPPLTFTSDQIVEVGLSDEVGTTKFNPPSLRGVSQQERLLHDGRATNLRAVFTECGHQVPAGLSEPDLDALVRFLQSL